MLHPPSKYLYTHDQRLRTPTHLAICCKTTPPHCRSRFFQAGGISPGELALLKTLLAKSRGAETGAATPVVDGELASSGDGEEDPEWSEDKDISEDDEPHGKTETVPVEEYSTPRHRSPLFYHTLTYVAPSLNRLEAKRTLHSAQPWKAYRLPQTESMPLFSKFLYGGGILPFYCFYTGCPMLTAQVMLAW